MIWYYLVHDNFFVSGLDWGTIIEFLENAGRAFDGSRQAKEARRKEAGLKKTQAQMLKTIGQLTLERDFLQDCFRAAGRPIPKLPSEDQ